jgi:hypothetical protein
MRHQHTGARNRPQTTNPATKHRYRYLPGAEPWSPEGGATLATAATGSTEEAALPATAEEPPVVLEEAPVLPEAAAEPAGSAEEAAALAEAALEPPSSCV